MFLVGFSSFTLRLVISLLKDFDKISFTTKEHRQNLFNKRPKLQIRFKNTQAPCAYLVKLYPPLGLGCYLLTVGPFFLSSPPFSKMHAGACLIAANAQHGFASRRLKYGRYLESGCVFANEHSQFVGGEGGGVDVSLAHPLVDGGLVMAAGGRQVTGVALNRS